MKFAISILWVALIMAGSIFCRYGYTETYTTTVTRAVGPTELTGARGTLPVPSPNDTNSIWVAPNGSDANPGTEASPKQTISAAIGALGGSATNVQIFRNGYVGDLIFSEASFSNLISATMQVEDGEIAILRRTSGSLVMSMASATVNGVHFTAVDSDLSNNVLLQDSTLQNCLVTRADQTKLGVVFTSSNTDGTFDYSVARTFYTQSGNSTTGTLTGNNSIIVADSSSEETGTIAPIEVQVTLGGGTVNINFDRCYIYNREQSGSYTSPFNVATSASASGFTNTINITLESTVIESPGPLVRLYSLDTGGATINLSVTSDYVKSGAGYSFEVDPDGEDITVSDTIATTNRLNPSSPNMFVDEATGVDPLTDPTEVADALRLQFEGKDVADGEGTYFMDSPLVGAGNGGEDAAPWDESTAFASNSFASTMTLDSDPSSHSTVSELVNPVEVNTLLGGIRTDHDAERVAWSFQWPAGNRYSASMTWKQLRILRRDKGVKAIYLRGANGDHLEDLNNGSSLTGTYSDTDDSVTLVSPAIDTIEDNWAMWIMELNGEDFLITSNDSSNKFLLQALPGSTFPANGTYSVYVRYFLGMIRLEPMPLAQQYTQADFAGGSRWAEWDLGIDPVDRTGETLPPGGYNVTVVMTSDLIRA